MNDDAKALQAGGVNAQARIWLQLWPQLWLQVAVLAPPQTPQPSVSVNNHKGGKVIHFYHTPKCPPSRCPRGLLYLSTFFISSPFFCPD